MKQVRQFGAAVIAMSLSVTIAGAEDSPPMAPVDGRIGYAMTNLFWSVYQTPQMRRTECPNGFNDGPREQFEKLFPQRSMPRTVENTQLTSGN